MKVPLINISSESIIGVPALVHFDSQFENEPLYAMLGLTLQTRDGKENPPRFATYYTFEKKEYPLCYGFCSVLFNWALLEAYNRFILAYPDTKVVLKTSDLCFDYEEFVPVDELCKLYLERIKIPYKAWLTCSPKLRHYTDSDNSLFSRLLFDEYENLLDFSNRGIFSDFTEKQQEDFITWWECIEDYITRHYKIEIPLHSISEKVMDYLLETERFRLPKGYTLSSYSPNAKFCLDRTKNATEDKTTYHINIMPTHIYNDNAQHIDHSRTITINGASIDDLGGFLRDFMSDEPQSSSTPQPQEVAPSLSDPIRNVESEAQVETKVIEDKPAPMESMLFRTDKSTLQECWNQFTEIITTSPSKRGKQKVLSQIRHAANSLYFNPNAFGHEELAEELNRLQKKFVFNKADIDAATKRRN